MNEYRCEVCDKIETLTEEQAYDAGWDYPPFMGVWGVVSMRTCPDCGMTDTAWYAIAVEGRTFEELAPRQQATVTRIILEVER